MRNEKSLISLIRKLADLLAEESTRNPDFAERLTAILQPPSRPLSRKKSVTESPSPIQLPDIHNELSARGDADFRLWIRDQPISLLRALIRAQGFDPSRRTTKWKEGEKLADFIYESLRARLSKGSSFIRSKTNEHPD